MPKIHDTSGANGGRRARGARVSSSLAKINVVPLVDVMLVLLIIFMVTAPMMQQGLQVNLPQARKATPVTATPIYVTVPADFGRSKTVQLDKESVKIDFLQERVRQAEGRITETDAKATAAGDSATKANAAAADAAATTLSSYGIHRGPGIRSRAAPSGN